MLLHWYLWQVGPLSWKKVLSAFFCENKKTVRAKERQSRYSINYVGIDGMIITQTFPWVLDGFFHASILALLLCKGLNILLLHLRCIVECNCIISTWNKSTWAHGFVATVKWFSWKVFIVRVRSSGASVYAGTVQFHFWVISFRAHCIVYWYWLPLLENFRHFLWSLLYGLVADRLKLLFFHRVGSNLTSRIWQHG